MLVILVSIPSPRVDFLHEWRFDTSSAIPFQSPLYYSPDCFISLFSYVHYSGITSFAAKSGLTTPPAQRCRYFAILSYSTVVSSSLHHVQFLRLNFMAQTKAQSSTKYKARGGEKYKYNPNPLNGRKTASLPSKRGF